MNGVARGLFAAVLILSAAGPAWSFEFEPVKPLDTREVEPAFLSDVFGTWEIRSRNGKKRCRVVLLKEMAIGGYGIEIAPACKASFPVMDDVAGWRLLEGFGIDLIDPMRKTRIRFQTPDNPYVAFGDEKDIAGMDDFLKISAKPAVKKRN